MRAKTWFQISAVLMLIFAAGHTFGFLSFRAPSVEGRAVFDAMNRVTFSDGHSSFSYGRFYTGFGLTITVFQLFSAWLAWFLSRISARCPAEARSIAWALCTVQIIGAVLSFKYFSLPPAIFSIVAAILFATGALSTLRSRLLSS